MTGYVHCDPMWDDLRFPVSSINPVGQAAPPTLNVDNGLLEFDIHFQCDGLGSVQQLAKQGSQTAAHGDYGLTVNQ